MARSYQNYKQNLNEQEQKLLEIGQRVQPYEKNFVFVEKNIDIFTEFQDDQKNNIKIIFHRFKEGSESFEVEFTVNGFSGEAFKTDTKHFFKIISTVVEAINEFIDKYQPTQIFIEGYDKLGKQGQKDRIWLQYAKVNLKADNYTLGIHPKGFGLQKNSKSETNIN
jgi:hypothetical protein